MTNPLVPPSNEPEPGPAAKSAFSFIPFDDQGDYQSELITRIIQTGINRNTPARVIAVQIAHQMRSKKRDDPK